MILILTMPRMDRASERRDGGGRRPWWGAAALLALMAALMLGGLLWSGLGTPAGSDAPADGASLKWLLISSIAMACLLLVCAAFGWHMGVRMTRQRMLEPLREARGQAQSLSQLLDVWQWQTDAGHHLVRWQAPQGVPASSWIGAAATQTLWERFVLVGPEPEPVADPAARLQLRLDERVPLQDVVVQGDVANGAAAQFSGRWRLRGVPCFDAAGRFSGYLGTAHALLPPPSEPDHHRGAGLDQWLQALPGPSMVVLELKTGALELLSANALAAALMGRGVEELRGLGWGQCRELLPAHVREALGEVSEGQPAPCGAWVLSRTPLAQDREGKQVLVSLWPQAGTAAAAPAATEPTLSDHESFSYTVSHDLRAPIRVVEGFTRILKEDYGRLLDRIGNDHLDRVMGAAARMNSMIDSLLALAQLSSQPLARQPVNLSQLARYIIDDLQRNAPERHVEVHVAPDMQVQGDPTLLRVALENLLGNAWKYSAKCEHAQIRFEHGLHEGRGVYLVRDNGAGFDMRFADRLFGVFQRLHSASDFQGTGVGLASVRRIIRRHGGEIWAESEVGRGASFYFTLPMR
jgi:signal transduction histidine kinase